MGLSGINRFNDAGCLPLTTQEWLQAAKLPKHTKMIQLHSSQVDYAIDAEHDNQHKCQQWPPQQEPLGIALFPSVDPLAHGPWRPEIHQEGDRQHGVSQGQIGDKIRHPSEHNVNLVGVFLGCCTHLRREMEQNELGQSIMGSAQQIGSLPSGNLT